MSGGQVSPAEQSPGKNARVFHANAVKWTVFTILTYGLLALGSAFLEARRIFPDAFSLGWDIVFCYFLFRGKNWARIVLIIRAALILLLLQISAWSEQNILGAILDGGIGLAILGLLFSLQKPKRAQILAGIAGAFFILAAALYLYGAQEKRAESSILRQMPENREWKSEHFRISLPDTGWKWLPKEYALRLMGESARGCEAGFAKLNGMAYGLIFFESVNPAIEREAAFAQARQMAREEYFGHLTVVSSEAEDDLLLTLAEGTLFGQPHAYISLYKIFAPGKALRAVLWSEQSQKDILLRDAKQVMASLSEF